MQIVMNRFDKVAKTVDTSVDGHWPWKWIRSDNLTFPYISYDWENSHREIIKQHVTEWTTVVQAGGNQGMYPRLLSTMFKVVYTFEPDPLNFHFLVNNCQSENIVKIQAALGETNAPVQVNRLTFENCGMHRVEEAEGAYIPQLRLDDFKLNKLGLLMLDIELYEIHALRGARQTLIEHKPVIMCENATTDIVEYLAELGYQPSCVSRMDTVFVHRG